MAILTGLMYRLKKESVWKINAVTKQIFAPHTVQQWPAVCSQFHANISGTLALMMNKWMDGAAKILKCHSASGNVISLFTFNFFFNYILLTFYLNFSIILIT